jgi:hypothetical protein
MNQWFMPTEYADIHFIYGFCDGYENSWIGHPGSIPWLPRLPDLALLDFFLLVLVKEMTYRTKVHMREALLHQIMDAAYIREHPKMIQQTVNSKLCCARLCTENCGRHYEQL